MEKGYEDEIEKTEDINTENIKQVNYGENVGQVIYNIDGKEYNVNIKIENSIEKKNNTLKIILLILFICLVLKVRKHIKKKKKRNKYNKKKKR